MLTVIAFQFALKRSVSVGCFQCLPTQLMLDWRLNEGELDLDVLTSGCVMLI
jgi:hypothetical protein